MWTLILLFTFTVGTNTGSGKIEFHGFPTQAACNAAVPTVGGEIGGLKIKATGHQCVQP